MTRCALLYIALGGLGSIAAQELEPRAYAANPVGVRFAIASVHYSTGDVVFEPTSVLSDVKADVYAAALGLGGTFALFGRTANAAVAVPYGWGTITGNVSEERASVDRAGLADMRVRVAVNWLGGRAMPLREFARRVPSTVVGTSVAISVPTGQYFSDRLINIGTNRWAFKPEIGVSHPAGPWTLELYGGGWFFTRNSSYYGQTAKEQRPLLSLQSHVAYTVRPRLWMAVDFTFYTGGRVVIDDTPAAERQENTRAGLTLSIPTLRTSSVKLAWSTGASTRLGGNFDTFSAAWQTTVLPRS
jgi:outer membrane putative beta-barrel porin/alpha-amylase